MNTTTTTNNGRRKKNAAAALSHHHSNRTTIRGSNCCYHHRRRFHGFAVGIIAFLLLLVVVMGPPQSSGVLPVCSASEEATAAGTSSNAAATTAASAGASSAASSTFTAADNGGSGTSSIQSKIKKRQRKGKRSGQRNDRGATDKVVEDGGTAPGDDKLDDSSGGVKKKEKKKKEKKKFYDCDNGCDIAVSKEEDGSPSQPVVCGVDGITYLNECIAICQGVDIDTTTEGACSNKMKQQKRLLLRKQKQKQQKKQQRGDSAPDALYYDDDNVIEKNKKNNRNKKKKKSGQQPAQKNVVSLKRLRKYEKEGFKYVNKRTKRIKYNERNEQEINPGRVKKPLHGLKRIMRTVRFVPETGDEYISDFIDMSDNEMNDDVATANDVDEGGGGGGADVQASTNTNTNDNENRILAIIGDDTRKEVRPTTKWPHTVVGSLFPKGYIGGCTATVISMEFAVTAAHCLWVFKDEEYYDLDRFAPGRYWDGDPFGVWVVDYVEVYEAYQEFGYPDYDFGVIKLKRRKKKKIGQVVGYAGIRLTTSPNSKSLQNARVPGYPFDKGLDELWTSSTCRGSWSRTSIHVKYESDILVYHECDTQRGNSGSPFLDYAGYVHGLQLYARVTDDEAEEGLVNIGNLLETMHYKQLKRWTGRRKNNVKPRVVPPEFKVIVQYDNNPGEVSWYLKDLTTNKILTGMYLKRSRLFPPNKRFYRTVKLIAGHRYDIFMSDTKGNGFCCTKGSAQGFIQIIGKRGGLTVYKKKFSGKFKYYKTSTFEMPVV